MSESHVGPLVVVAVDGSACSEDALRWAVSYAKAAGGRLRIVTAWSLPYMYGLPMAVDAWDPKGDAHRIAEKAAASVPLPPDRTEVRVDEGPAADVILAACDGADLLVVGAHGYRAVGRFLLGSVSNQCLHDAQIPVVVVNAVQDPARS